MIDKIYKREIYPQLVSELNSPYVIIITGSRRTGKTTLLRMLQNEVGVKDNNLYFDLENPIYRADFEQPDFDLIAAQLSLRVKDGHSRAYILLDEVQYLSNPAGFLKYMFDHYPQFKFIVSGSSSLKIKTIFSDSMVGRKRLFRLFPLTFTEFLTFKDKNHLISLTQKIDLLAEAHAVMPVSPSMKNELIREFEDYLTFGGYPETTLIRNSEKRAESLFEFYSSYIQKDISYLFSIESIDKFNKLIKLFASQIGQLVNNSEIANTLNLSRLTVEKYTFLLQNTFVLDLMKPYYTNIRSEISKMPKIYFEDVGICNAVSGNFNIINNPAITGMLAENYVFNQLNKKYKTELKFWRTKTKQEVDFVLEADNKIIPVEVKYREIYRSKIPGGLRSFIMRYHSPLAYVITKDYYSIDNLQETKIVYLPIYLI